MPMDCNISNRDGNNVARPDEICQVIAPCDNPSSICRQGLNVSDVEEGQKLQPLLGRHFHY